MGSKSSAKNDTTTITTTTHETDIDNTSMAGDGQFVQGDGNVIHSSDAEVLKHLGAENTELLGNISKSMSNLASNAFDSSAEMSRVASSISSSALSSANRLGGDAFNLAGDTNRTMADLAGYFGGGAFDLADNVSYGLMQLAAGSQQTAADSSKGAMSLIDNFTRREQTGTEGEAIRWLVIGTIGVAGFAALQMMKGK